VTNKRIRIIFLFSILIGVLILFWGYEKFQRDSRSHLLYTLSIRNESLSQFWGKDVYLKAVVILPPDWLIHSGHRYPLLLHFPGFGGDETQGEDYYPWLKHVMQSEPDLSMVHVFLDPTFPTGYNYFVDSENNGPWATALVRDFIPSLESQFPIVNSSTGRFLTGHSSGGWTSLWLQIQYPDFFGGVWASSPDPVDLRDFFGVDLTPGSKSNMYFNKKHIPRPAYRGTTLSQKEFIASEEEENPERNEWIAYEAAWGKKNADGKPQKLFDRDTGKLQQETLVQWQNYNLRKLIEDRWELYGTTYTSKLHLYCGTEDTFFLEQPLKLFCARLENFGAKGNCTFIEGRTHINLYKNSPEFPEGLSKHQYREMIKVFRASEEKPG
jgi:hypothetical protein